jgi:hypothetical protein
MALHTTQSLIEGEDQLGYRIEASKHAIEQLFRRIASLLIGQVGLVLELVLGPLAQRLHSREYDSRDSHCLVHWLFPTFSCLLHAVPCFPSYIIRIAWFTIRIHIHIYNHSITISHWPYPRRLY